MASAEAVERFAAVTTTVKASSPLLALFRRASLWDTDLTEIDLVSDQEFIRWPPERQAAALLLLVGNPYLAKITLIGLNLSDAVAPAVPARLPTRGSIES